jgi:hypothetical protein
MNACKRVKKMLVAFLSDELGADESRIVQRHLKECRSCQTEFHRIQETFEGIDSLLEDCSQAVKDESWELEFPDPDHFRIPSKPIGRIHSLFIFPGWKASSIVLTTVFMMGLLIGYFLFHSSESSVPRLKGPVHNGLALNRIEVTLSRKQAIDFFRQTQLLLTGVLEQCHIPSEISLNPHFSTKQVRALLKKNRYFSQDLNRPELMSSKNLLNKIEFVLLEMLMMDEQTSCEEFHRLQQLIQQENILLKIRLIEKELTTYEV